jgi:hypothetical protein
MNRIPLKLKGPKNSIPDFWAAKAKPQIQAVVRRRLSALRTDLFIPYGITGFPVIP